MKAVVCWSDNRVRLLLEDIIRAVSVSFVLGLPQYLRGVASDCHRGIKCGNTLLIEDARVELGALWCFSVGHSDNEEAKSHCWFARLGCLQNSFEIRITMGELMLSLSIFLCLKSSRIPISIPLRANSHEPAPTLADADDWSPEIATRQVAKLIAKSGISK